MAEAPQRFKQIDVTRALKGTLKAGLPVAGYKIDPATGAIEVWTHDAPGRLEANEWDEAAK